jgi:hypothetical protein
MAIREENEILYRTFKDFANRCFVQDTSLLWPDKSFWTLANLKELKKRMIDNPILGGTQSFGEKLNQQVSGGLPDLWAIICDIYFVYFMPSTHIGFDRKLGDIRGAAEEGNLVLPGDEAEIWKALNNGFTKTGFKYHQKFSHFWLIILAAIAIKEHDDPTSIIKNHKAFRQTLDMVLEEIPNRSERANDMRHAMLYMRFPEYYERSISTADKQRIIAKYSDNVVEELASDLDEKLLQIRKSLSEKYNKPDREFDFYQDLKETWKTFLVPVKKDENETTQHTEIQWLLLRLGNEMGFDIWVAKNDRNKMFEGQRFAELPRLKKELPVQFDEATNRTIQLIDVLWLRGNAIVGAFEIESTTSIYSGLLRMADLIAMQPSINIPLYIVAPDERRSKVMEEVNRPVFSCLNPPMRYMCKYISFSALKANFSKALPYMKHLRSGFLDDFSENCDMGE